MFARHSSVLESPRGRRARRRVAAVLATGAIASTLAIGRADAAGDPGTQLTAVQDPMLGETVARRQQPRGVVASDEFVFWTNGDGSVRKAPVAGGRAVIVAKGFTNPTEMAIDRDHAGAPMVFWLDAGVGNSDAQCQGKADGSIVRLDGPVVTGLTCPANLRYFGERVYWLERHTGEIRWTSSRGGGEIKTIAKTDGFASGFGLDANGLVYFAKGSHELTRVSLYVNLSEVLSKDPDIDPRFVSPSADGIYYMQGRAIMRAPLDGSAPGERYTLPTSAVRAVWQQGSALVYTTWGADVFQTYGDRPQLLADRQRGQMNAIAANSSHVFWITDNLVKRAPLQEPEPPPVPNEFTGGSSNRF